MYEEFFGFSGSPFRLAPDPKFFFGSKSHNKAMAYLHYGLRQAEGFIVITGEIGAGKSVLIGHLIDQLDRSNVLAANLVTPNLAPEDLLSHILSAFRIEPSGSGKTAEIEAFEDFLFDQMNHGRRVLLIVDEAQNLPIKTLEELRVLSNLEYDGTPLFQVFLIGQPDFRETMARSDMEQLRQRVIATYHLEPMSRDETEKYIEHRLAFVGWNGEPKISADAFAAIYAATGGVPRKIHKLCNRVLLFCSVENLRQIDGATVALTLSDMSAEQAAGTPAMREAAVADLDAPAAFEAAAQAMREITPVMAAPASAPERELPQIAETSIAEPLAVLPSSPAGPSPAVSVFDRLRARKKSAATAGTLSAEEIELSRPPKAATLDDVANAIAAARADAVPELAQVIAAPVVEPELAPIEEAPASEDLPEGWKKSVVMSINDTRDELKRAHQSVAKLRRQVTEIDRRRNKRRVQIAASLERAESLLSEFQNAWR
ncbi:MAG: XrtA/PEP-CTERM system-associated ATPase [Pseudomonadota bacterium]